MNEFLFELNAARQIITLYLLHRLISEAETLSGIKAASLIVIGAVHHLDKLRIEIAYSKAPSSLEASLDANPLNRIKNWLVSRDISLDEIRIETPSGVCRVFNLDHSY